MNQQFTLVRIGGLAGEAILSQIATLQSIDSVNGEGCKSVNDACESIREWVDRYANTPPVIFYCRYADMWSGGDLFSRMLGDEYGADAFKNTDCAIALALRLPENDVLAAHIEHQLSGELQFDEDRMFLEIMLKATRTWSGLCRGGALLVFRDVVGSTVTDEELLKSLEAHLPFDGLL